MAGVPFFELATGATHRLGINEPGGFRQHSLPQTLRPTFSIRSQEVRDARELSWCARTPYGIAVLRYDDVGNQLGLAMSMFVEHPDQWRLLADRPDLARSAVEEVMRVRPTCDMGHPRGE